MQLRSQMNHWLVVLCELCVSEGIEPDGKEAGAGLPDRLQSHKVHFTNAVKENHEKKVDFVKFSLHVSFRGSTG